MTKDIVPPFIGENIERSKKRRAMIEEIIKYLDGIYIEDNIDIDYIVGKLEKLKEIS